MCRTRLGFCGITLLVGTSLVAADGPKRPSRNRAEFARAISQTAITPRKINPSTGRPPSFISVPLSSLFSF